MMRRPGVVLFCALVVISILVFYTAYDKQEKAIDLKDLADVFLIKDFGHTLEEFNKVSALSGMGFLSMAMVIGPLVVFFPGILKRYLSWRKLLGLTGVTFIILHSIYGIAVKYQFSISRMFFENDKLLGVIAALLSLVIFLVMAGTSNSASIKALGFKRLKTLHRLGYAALALGALHFIIMETKIDGSISVRPYGWVFLYLPFITLFLKFASIIYVSIKDRYRSG